ncbi:MAG: hypothetical protein K9J76_01180 [Polaromonas sp.]|nr:hypothetical protein [Polaromonas sp.]
MSLTQKSWAVCLVSAALLGSYGVSAQTETPQTSPIRSFATDLAKANLAKKGVTDPTEQEISDAEATIQAQRVSGMGWGEIANSLGLKLGAVVSAANRAQPAARDAAHAKKSAESGEKSQGATASGNSDSGAGNSGGKGGGSSGGSSGGNGGGGNSGGGGRGK